MREAACISYPLFVASLQPSGSPEPLTGDLCLQTYQIPKEIVWLNGAPGSGKGANTPFILESRGLTRAVTMSSLLERHPGIRELMEAGELVPDTMVWLHACRNQANCIHSKVNTT